MRSTAPKRNLRKAMTNITIMPKTASIFDSQMKVLVNPVNTQGRSSKGLALEFAKRYPETQAEYEMWCRSGKLRGGGSINVTHFKHPDKMILYAFTKEDPRKPSRLEWIEMLMKTCEWGWLARGAYNSFAIPALGCGLGCLNWDDVRPIIEAAFVDIDCEVELYPPR